MSWTATLTAGTTSASGGPFPPDYNVGAVGYVIAASNPTGDSTGTLSGDGTYLDIIIAAMAYDAASPNATQFMVALEGSYDQAFLGNVTFTDAAGPQTYLSADANFIQQTVAGQALTLWIWPATGYFDSTDAYTINISDTTDTPIVLSGAAVSSTEIQLAFNDQTVGAAEIYQLWGAANSSTLSLIRSGIVPGSMPMDLTLTALAANTQYTYQVVGVIDGATEILSSTCHVGGGENWGEYDAVGFSAATIGAACRLHVPGHIQRQRVAIHWRCSRHRHTLSHAHPSGRDTAKLLHERYNRRQHLSVFSSNLRQLRHPAW